MCMHVNMCMCNISCDMHSDMNVRAIIYMAHLPNPWQCTHVDRHATKHIFRNAHTPQTPFTPTDTEWKFCISSGLSMYICMNGTIESPSVSIPILRSHYNYCLWLLADDLGPQASCDRHADEGSREFESKHLLYMRTIIMKHGPHTSIVPSCVCTLWSVVKW